MKIDVKNYQIIEDLSLDFSGVVCVQGTNDTGKSALIRAVRGLVQTQGGDDFINYDADQTEVSIEIDGDKITWTKPRSGGGEYTINGTEYDKIGRGRFEELQKYGLWPVQAGRNEFDLNFVDQFDSLLLFGRPDTRKFEIISSALIEYDKFQDALDNIKDDQKDIKENVTKTEGKIETLDENIEKKQEKKKTYDSFFDDYPQEFVEVLEQQMEEGRQVSSLSTDWADKQDSLEGISLPSDELIESTQEVYEGIDIDHYKDLSIQVKNWGETLNDISYIEKLLDAWGDVDIASVEKLVESCRLIEQYIDLKGELNKMDRAIEVFEGIEFDDLSESYDDFGGLFEMVEKYDRIKDEADELDEDIAELNEELEELENEIEEIEQKLGICPVCGSDFECS